LARKLLRTGSKNWAQENVVRTFLLGALRLHEVVTANADDEFHPEAFFDESGGNAIGGKMDAIGLCGEGDINTVVDDELARPRFPHAQGTLEEFPRGKVLGAEVKIVGVSLGKIAFTQGMADEGAGRKRVAHERGRTRRLAGVN
jgi:hypothetical protein